MGGAAVGGYLISTQMPDRVDKPRLAGCNRSGNVLATCDRLRLASIEGFSRAIRLKLRSETGVPRKPLISVVDDDVSVGAAIRSLLRSVGFATEAFQSAEDFLASRQLHRTSCLITDLNMTGMSGYALHKQLVASGRNIPTVLITAYHDDSIREEALKDGVICYLIKPFDENDLLACVRSALDNLRGKYLS